jgi:hypothetical protein
VWFNLKCFPAPSFHPPYLQYKEMRRGCQSGTGSGRRDRAGLEVPFALVLAFAGKFALGDEVLQQPVGLVPPGQVLSALVTMAMVQV